MRNTARFMLSNLFDFDRDTDFVSAEKMLALDFWAVRRAALLERELREDYANYQFHLVSQKIHRFCAVDMGAFYLDIIKDRQYTMHKESLSRRSGQSAMFLIAEALTRWISPVLSFTAEELWEYLPGKREESVFLSSYGDQLSDFAKKEGTLTDQDWDRLIQVRDAVNQLVEQFRASDKLGSPLEAEITLYCEKPLLNLIKSLGEELRFLLLSSEARVSGIEQGAQAHETQMPGLKVDLHVSSHAKCGRCWHRRPDVGSLDPKDLCSRCIRNIGKDTGKVEERRFV
jgi:isoleucyl-tRNA synthetase